MTRRVGVLLVLAALVGGPIGAANAAPVMPATTKLRLVRVASARQPTAVVGRAGDARLYIAERLGRVMGVTATSPATANGTVLIDLSAEVASGAEEGLLGLAFSPDGSKSYVHFVDKKKASHIVEFGVEASDTGLQVVPESRREVLTIPGTARGHHYGGWLDVADDGMLWIAFGDGNGDGDKLGRAQDLTSLLGKILRIDPTPSKGLGYSIPPGNPFAKRAGARPEIWAYGLRNPWRASLDPPTGVLWIGDVGEGKYEEVNRSKSGENFGWPLVEGTHRLRGRAPAGTTMPVHEYPHRGGQCAVVGGHVYCGAALPALKGIYVFADLCTGRLTGLVDTAGKVVPLDLGPGTLAITSLDTDTAGEIYATSLNGGVFKLVGA